MKGMDKRAFGTFTFLLLIFGAAFWVSGNYVTTQEMPIVKEEEKTEVVFGLIKGVERRGLNEIFIDLDRVEFLFREEAMQAAIEDTNCKKEEIENCAPSMNNNFYIRDIGGDARTYALGKETKIKVFKDPGAPELEEVSLADFEEQFGDEDRFISAYPFKLIVYGIDVLDLEEQYMP